MDQKGVGSLREKFKVKDTDNIQVKVSAAACGIASGALEIFDLLRENSDTNTRVIKTGCMGFCHSEPTIEVVIPQVGEKIYGGVDALKALRILKEAEKHSLYSEEGLYDHPLLKKIALNHCGSIDPEDIDDAVSIGGYQALSDLIFTGSPEKTVNTIKNSGLKGRGGGGFPTGIKWEYAANNKAPEKYVICNADEGDPGAFMDRSILEGNPHCVLEALAIAGYAIGSTKGFIYIRAEYPLAVERLKIAIKQAEEKGLLGKNILGSTFSFDIELRLGAGAFVCGEEMALIASIEGERGLPRNKPPFPAEKGLWGMPTIINNVETLANIPQIILNGVEWFKGIGLPEASGTKVFALGGKINNTGLVEIPMGTSLTDIIYNIGGGIPNGKRFKALQTGGPSGGCIPGEFLNTPIEYKSLIKLGSMMGSGGMIVMDEDNCMVDIARFFLEFSVDESCGKCTPCREGTKVMLKILEDICSGNGSDGDIERLEGLATTIKSSSLCGLGQTAPNPVLSTLKYFKHEYEEHIHNKNCPAKACKSLLSYAITDKCIGCTKCSRVCPVEAISGSVKETHTLNSSVCIRCNACMEACPVGAVIKK